MATNKPRKLNGTANKYQVNQETEDAILAKLTFNDLDVDRLDTNCTNGSNQGNTVKCYSRKRSVPKKDIIESFGLPDESIIPLNPPYQVTEVKNDVTFTEGDIFDMGFFNYLEFDFHFDELRKKEEFDLEAMRINNEKVQRNMIKKGLTVINEIKKPVPITLKTKPRFKPRKKRTRKKDKQSLNDNLQGILLEEGFETSTPLKHKRKRKRKYSEDNIIKNIAAVISKVVNGDEQELVEKIPLKAIRSYKRSLSPRKSFSWKKDEVNLSIDQLREKAREEIYEDCSESSENEKKGKKVRGRRGKKQTNLSSLEDTIEEVIRSYRVESNSIEETIDSVIRNNTVESDNDVKITVENKELIGEAINNNYEFGKGLDHSHSPIQQSLPVKKRKRRSYVEEILLNSSHEADTESLNEKGMDSLRRSRRKCSSTLMFDYLSCDIDESSRKLIQKILIEDAKIGKKKPKVQNDLISNSSILNEDLKLTENKREKKRESVETKVLNESTKANSESTQSIQQKLNEIVDNNEDKVLSLEASSENNRDYIEDNKDESSLKEFSENSKDKSKSEDFNKTSSQSSQSSSEVEDSGIEAQKDFVHKSDGIVKELVVVLRNEVDSKPDILDVDSLNSSESNVSSVNNENIEETKRHTEDGRTEAETETNLKKETVKETDHPQSQNEEIEPNFEEGKVDLKQFENQEIKEKEQEEVYIEEKEKSIEGKEAEEDKNGQKLQESEPEETLQDKLKEQSANDNFEAVQKDDKQEEGQEDTTFNPNVLEENMDIEEEQEKTIDKSKQDEDVQEIGQESVSTKIQLDSPTKEASRSLKIIEELNSVIEELNSSNIARVEDSKPLEKEESVKIDLEYANKALSGLEETEYEEGALTWARISCYPYWPCLVTKDPESHSVSRSMFIKGKERLLYHVRFFGDRGRRCWMRKTHMMTFRSKDDMTNLISNKHLLPKHKLLIEQFCRPLKKHFKPKWEIAVQEAAALVDKSVQERLEFFEKLLENSHNRKAASPIEDKGEFDKEKNLTIDKKRSPKSSLGLSPPNKRLRSERLSDAMKKGIETRSSSGTPVSNRKSNDDSSETESRYSDASSIAPTLSSQSSLFRRNNLFRKIFNNKVCSLCMTDGELLKCGGACGAFYHSECAKLVLQHDFTVYHSKFALNSSLKEEEKSDKIDVQIKTEPGDVSENIPDQANIETIEEANEETGQVEIITVKSNKFNTPPKSPGEEVMGLSLSDKIDYKMKEIMCKFDNVIYVDSTDTSSSEETLNSQKTERVFVPAPIKVDPDAFHPELKKKKQKRVFSHVTAEDDLLESDCEVTEEPQFRCGFCEANVNPVCLVCHRMESKTGSDIRRNCKSRYCKNFYHPECLKNWPQTQWSLSKTQGDNFVCPTHVCHTCCSDDPRSGMTCSPNKLVKCLRCPATYHSSNFCIPAGTLILSLTQIICPRHYWEDLSVPKNKKLQTINTNWCFLCSEGGKLICCETCPTSVHQECLPVQLNEEDVFICEDCESGRFPLYDEVVWAKLGYYRWWPAVILFPNEIPEDLREVKHYPGEFLVQYYGTYDYYWVIKGRTFLFQEGDKTNKSVKNKVDSVFVKAVEEATTAFLVKKEFKHSKELNIKSGLKPPSYVRIKVNKPVGNVKQFAVNSSSTTACECDPKKANPCGPNSDCINRLLLVECSPDVCPAGKKCKNQSFEKREYPPLVPYMTQGRGWGLKTLAPIKRGQFVIEYVGEIIDEQEYQRRIQRMHECMIENYYFLTIDNNRMLDAGPKGNVARFMNHSCQPNCETQKWTVNGDTRVGLFATEDIPANTELTFNYNLECVGKERKICKCGAATCSGFIGLKKTMEASNGRTKKSFIKRKPIPVKEIISEPCFICGVKDNVIACNNKICNRKYHMKCLGLVDQDESKFICPSHNCNICSKRTIRCCVNCTNSYCHQHSSGSIRHYSRIGFLCSLHDENKEVSNKEAIADVDLTTTTSDDESVGSNKRTSRKDKKSPVNEVVSLVDSEESNGAEKNV